MTIVRQRPIGELLGQLLRGAHDDGQPELVITHDPPALVILRADGTELSASEQLEVRALLAADDVEPLGS